MNEDEYESPRVACAAAKGEGRYEDPHGGCEALSGAMRGARRHATERATVTWAGRRL